MPARDIGKTESILGLFALHYAPGAFYAWAMFRLTCQFQQPRAHARKGHFMTLVIYLVGWLILIGGVSWALVAMHVTQHTILIVDVILLGIAVITGATRARNRDRS